MKVNFKIRDVIINTKQKRIMERKLLALRKFVKNWSPVIVDLTLTDESGPDRNGIDQAVHINVILPKEKIYIEEVDNNMMRAFNYATKTLERRFRRYNKKNIDNNRREASRFKAITNVVGAPIRLVGSAGKAVGRFVPKRRRNKK